MKLVLENGINLLINLQWNIIVLKYIGYDFSDSKLSCSKLDDLRNLHALPQIHLDRIEELHSYLAVIHCISSSYNDTDSAMQCNL